MTLLHWIYLLLAWAFLTELLALAWLLFVMMRDCRCTGDETQEEVLPVPPQEPPVKITSVYTPIEFFEAGRKVMLEQQARASRENEEAT